MSKGLGWQRQKEPRQSPTQCLAPFDWWTAMCVGSVECGDCEYCEPSQRPIIGTEEMMEPRIWESLDDVPDDVDVYDTGYRIWYVRPDYAERYYRAGDIPIVWERPAMQGPYTEVLS